MRLRSGEWLLMEERAEKILMAERKIDKLLGIPNKDWLSVDQLRLRETREIKTLSGATPDPHFFRGIFGRVYAYKSPRPHSAPGTNVFDHAEPSFTFIRGIMSPGGSGGIDFFTRDPLLPRHTHQGDNYCLTRYQRSRIRHEAAAGGYRGTPEYLATKYGIPVRAIRRLTDAPAYR
jgi:hypothetical protein